MSSPLLRKKSPFQKRMENVMRYEFAGGLTPLGLEHTLLLVTQAQPEDTHSLDPDCSPIGMAMKCVYVLDEHESKLWELINACRRKGVNINGGDCIDGHFERPLVLAASLGKHKWFFNLLSHGANPNDTDGRGRNALQAAFDKRDITKRWFPRHMIDEHRRSRIAWRRRFESSPCDISIGLYQRHLVTNSLALSRQHSDLVYINGNSVHGSPLLLALLNRRDNDIRCIVDYCGAVLTDKDYLVLHKLGRLPLLERAVLTLLPPENRHGNMFCYSECNSWSFPPTYRVAIALTDMVGLPEDVFHNHLQPFLGRDWFFTEEQLEARFLTPAMTEEFRRYN